MSKGKLYLIPAPLGENDPAEVIPAPVLALLPTLDCFVVEEVRTARRYLSRAGLKGHIEGLEFHELNEHTAPAEIAPLARLFDGQVALFGLNNRASWEARRTAYEHVSLPLVGTPISQGHIAYVWHVRPSVRQNSAWEGIDFCKR